MQQRHRPVSEAPAAPAQAPVERQGAGGYNYRLHADGRVEIVKSSGSVFVTRASNATAYDAILAEVGPYPANANASSDTSSSETPLLDAFEEDTAPAQEATQEDLAPIIAQAPEVTSQEPVTRTGAGGYTYRLHADGAVEIIRAGRAPVVVTAESNARAYNAIIGEVGGYPQSTAAAPEVQAPAAAPVTESPVTEAPVTEAPATETSQAEEGGILSRVTERITDLFSWGEEEAEVQAEEGPAKESEGRDVHSMDRSQLAAILAAPETHGLGVWAAAYGRDKMLEHQEQATSTGTGTIEGMHTEEKTPGAEREDCTTYVLETLSAAFNAAGKGALWNQVRSAAIKNSGEAGLKGIELMKALQAQAGWKSLFWAADTQKSADDDKEHTFAASIASRRGTYYGAEVDKDNAVTNYRRTDEGAEADLTGLENLKKVPVAVLAARGGTHMGLMINGAVYEVHWKGSAKDATTIEATPLENWGWLSGMVTAPGGDIDRAFGQ